jgi:hypothetical protein
MPQLPREELTMTADEIREKVKDYDEIMLADGLEDAFIGVATQFNTSFAVYDRAKCIEILMTRDGMAEDEAEECFEFNTQGAYVGKCTPAFLTRG